MLKAYGVTAVTSDRYAERWTVSAFARHGVKLIHSERERSQIYLDTLPLFTTGRARLLDNERLVAQFAGLVRTTSPSGRDKVDHGKTGADDICNSAAGAMILATSASKKISWSAVAGDRTLTTDSAESHGYGGTWPRPVELHERPPERLWPTGDVRFG